MNTEKEQKDVRPYTFDDFITEQINEDEVWNEVFKKLNDIEKMATKIKKDIRTIREKIETL